MDAMMITLSPAEGRDLLNGILTILVRKKFPVNYRGWVYICIKNDKKYQLQKVFSVGRREYFYTLERTKECSLNGKVVARFWCDKVENIKWHKDTAIDLDYYKVVNVIENEEILKASCLQLKELEDYLQIKNAKNIPVTWGITFNLGYAIHITSLERFKGLRELKDFAKLMPKNDFICFNCPHYWTDDSAGYSIDKCGLDACEKLQLKQVPKTYCYIETPSTYTWLEEK